MKRYLLFFSLCLVLGFSLLSQFSLTLKPGFAVVSPLASASTLDNGLHISGNNMTRIENKTVDVKGTIVVEGNATLYLVNSTIRFWNKKRTEYNMMTLRNPADGNPRLILKDSDLISKYSRPFAIRFYGNSCGDFRMMNAEVVGVRLDVKAYDSSVVSLSGCTFYSVYVYDYSNVTISSSKFGTLHAEGSPVVSVLASKFKSMLYPVLHASGDSVVSVEGCTVEGNMSVYDHSVLSISDTEIEGGWRLSVNNHSRVEIISNSRVSVHKFSTEVDICGSSFFSVSHGVLQNVRVHVYGDSVLSISDTDMTYTTVFAHGSSNVTISRSRLDWFLRTQDHSVVSVLNSTLTKLSVEDVSVVCVSNSTLTIMHAQDSVDATVSNSIMEELSIVSDSINCSIASLGQGFFDCWDFTSSIDTSRGYSPRLTLINTQIRGCWDFRFFGSSNVTIANSTIDFLGAFDSSMIKMMNSTLNSQYVSDQAEVYVWSYLRVHVVDRFGKPLAWANVALQFSNESVVESKVADANGWVMFTVFERLITSSDVIKVDGYLLDATWEESSGQQSVKVAGSKEIALTLPLPWWYEYAIVGGFVVAGVGVVLFVIIMKRRASKPGTK